MTTEPTPASLRRRQYRVVDFGDIKEHARNAFGTPVSARTLRPSVDFDRWFPPGGRVAVLGVRIATDDDLAVLTRFVVDPAFRGGCDLLIWADKDPSSFADGRRDEDFAAAWTLDRLRFVLNRYSARRIDDALPPLTPIEERLLTALRARGLRPMVQFGVDPFRVDFAFPDRRLAIEADGRDWHDAIRDDQRDRALQARGWQVLHLSGSDIHRDPAGCTTTVLTLYEMLPAQLNLSDSLERRPSWWRRLLRLVQGKRVASDPAATYVAEPGLLGRHSQLDTPQQAAVDASDGVTQIIAPAGSGKTTVLVERVVELLARGVPANRILCATFNRSAREELRERLTRAGVPTVVDVHTFHSLGRHILDTDRRLPAEKVSFAWGEWRKLAGQVANEPGMTFLDAAEASDWVSRFKLVNLATPEQLADDAKNPQEATARRIYALYEEELARRDGWDFDDLIFKSATYLRDDTEARRRWQDRWWCVLVDEYQDIEPAQELLIRIVAAPHDCLFVVGDEDQCIYAWRRANVERIVELDKIYPTLERVLLTQNYRSARGIVTAADTLIRHNTIRFPKSIAAARTAPGTVIALGFEDPALELQSTVAWLQQQGDTTAAAVLARTAAQLRELAMACLDAGVPITAHQRVLRSSVAEQAVLAHLVVCFDPNDASPEDVITAFRYPNRYLPNGAASQVVEGRRRARTFMTIAAGLPRLEPWRASKLHEAAPLYDTLAGLQDTSSVMRFLRQDMGLDNHFTSRDQMTPTDNEGRDALDTLTKLAEGVTIRELTDLLRERRDRLAAARTGDGFELTTIHGAKGKEWRCVTLFGADAKVMPHQRALQDAPDEDALASVWEDERRLAYVAYTRARDQLRVTWTKTPSSFHGEAGLTGPAKGPIAQPQTTSRRQPTPTSAGPARPGTNPHSPRPAPRQAHAKYPSTCSGCRRLINTGDAIAHNGTRWVHAPCVGLPSPPPF